MNARTERRDLARSGVTRLAFRVAEGAAVLGVSQDFFAEHIAPELKWVRRGSLKLVARAELERWLERNAARTLDTD